MDTFDFHLKYVNRTPTYNGDREEIEDAIETITERLPEVTEILIVREDDGWTGVAVYPEGPVRGITTELPQDALRGILGVLYTDASRRSMMPVAVCDHPVTVNCDTTEGGHRA